MHPTACAEAQHGFVIVCREAKKQHVLKDFSDLADLCGCLAVDSRRIAGTLIPWMAKAELAVREGERSLTATAGGGASTTASGDARPATPMGTIRTVETMKIQWIRRRQPQSTAAPATMPEAAGRAWIARVGGAPDGGGATAPRDGGRRGNNRNNENNGNNKIQWIRRRRRESAAAPAIMPEAAGRAPIARAAAGTRTAAAGGAGSGGAPGNNNKNNENNEITMNQAPLVRPGAHAVHRAPEALGVT